MKKPLYFLLFSLVLFGLVSCENDNDGDYYTGIALVSIIPTENGYYFRQDNGESIYPSVNFVSGYELPQKDQRAFIYYSLLETEQPGYDYSIKLFGIENILTKEILIVDSQEELEKIGNDPINITKAWMGDGYINIWFQFPFTSGSEPHYINLIQNKLVTSTSDNEDGIILEFRHNAYGDTNNIIHEGLAAFKVKDLLNPNIKKIFLKTKTLSDNLIYYEINISKAN